MSENITRIDKKGKRFYKREKKEKPPITLLIPYAIDTLRSLFPSNGDAPSVTTILGALAKPALISWAAREERKLVAHIAGDLYARLPQIVDEPITPQRFVDLLVEEAGKPANRRLLETAANVGTEVHKRIEWEFRGELGRPRDSSPPTLTTPQAERSFQRWMEWRKQVKLKVIDIEKQLYSSLFGFGGTLDLLAEITIQADPPTLPMTILVVIDFKTGKAIYGESHLQNIAYRLALMEEGIHPQGGWIVRLPKFEDDPEFDAQPVPNDPDLIPTFLALIIVYRWWGKQHPKRKYTPKKELPQVGVESSDEEVLG